MNRNTIKFVAAFCMFLDHYAVLILPADSMLWLTFRIIGRIAFVLFAYMIVEGFVHTSDLKKYLIRIVGFALFIELFILGYSIYTSSNEYLMQYNVIWPLAFGLGGLTLLKQKKIWIRLLAIPLVFLAEYINIPYGAYGTLMILLFGIYYDNKVTQFLFLVALNLLFIEVPLLSYVGLAEFARYPSDMWWQWFALVGYGFIFFYNGNKGKLNTKWFFYIFYPLHLGVIYLISIII